MSVFTDGKTNGPGICWPDGKRIAVMVTFDFDAEFLRISRAESKGTSIGFPNAGGTAIAAPVPLASGRRTARSQSSTASASSPLTISNR